MMRKAGKDKVFEGKPSPTEGTPPGISHRGPSEQGPLSEPKPSHEEKEQYFGSGGTPYNHGGEVRGDLQAQQADDQFGGMPGQGTKHRGRG